MLAARPFGARRRQAKLESGRSDSPPRVRHRAIRDLAKCSGGVCRDGRLLNRVLLAASAEGTSEGRFPDVRSRPRAASVGCGVGACDASATAMTSGPSLAGRGVLAAGRYVEPD